VAAGKKALQEALAVSRAYQGISRQREKASDDEIR
jgi:hypothetical protein